MKIGKQCINDLKTMPRPNVDRCSPGAGGHDTRTDRRRFQNTGRSRSHRHDTATAPLLSVDDLGRLRRNFILLFVPGFGDIN